jgi:uncharacterized damage-inducible protein DinB
MIKEKIERYAAGAPVPGQWIKGLTLDELRAHPVPGTWSIHTLAHHVLDSDLIASHRMKRIIAEDTPLLISYDETAFSKSLGYEKMDVQLACELFRLNRELTAQILRQLPEAAFARCGVHNQSGKVSLAQILDTYIQHLTHHETFLREKRTRLGKPL